MTKACRFTLISGIYSLECYSLLWKDIFQRTHMKQKFAYSFH